MKLKTFPFGLSIIMSVSILSLSITVQAQQKEVDTTQYVPYRMMQGHRVAVSSFGELNIRPYTNQATKIFKLIGEIPEVCR